MTSILLIGKYIKTAFFSHSLIIHLPSIFSAMRNSPLSNFSMTAQMALRTSSFSNKARSSQAFSMMFLKFSIIILVM